MSLADRDYSWNETMCWLDEDRLAVWGYGNDDLNLIPAVSIYDARSESLERWFPGPERGGLSFDGRWLLSAAADQAGVSAWDIDSGEQVARDPGCRVLAWDPSTRRLLTRVDGRLCTTRL